MILSLWPERLATQDGAYEAISKCKMNWRLLYILISCIAMGITQAISILFDTEELRGKLRFQRTAPKKISEANVVDYLRSHFSAVFDKRPTGQHTALNSETTD